MALKKIGKKPTMSDIKRMTFKEAPFYFDKKSMKFFGQTMASFKVHRSPSGRVFIYAKSYSEDYRTGKKQFMGYSIREFIDKGMKSDLKNTKYKGLSELLKVK